MRNRVFGTHRVDNPLAQPAREERVPTVLSAISRDPQVPEGPLEATAQSGGGPHPKGPTARGAVPDHQRRGRHLGRSIPIRHPGTCAVEPGQARRDRSRMRRSRTSCQSAEPQRVANQSCSRGKVELGGARVAGSLLRTSPSPRGTNASSPGWRDRGWDSPASSHQSPWGEIAEPNPSSASMHSLRAHPSPGRIAIGRA
jgi:hypothetical protein